MHRFLRKLLLCIPLLWLFCLPAAAAVGQPRSGGSYEVLYRNSLAQADAATTVYYSDRFFSHPATEYDAELALASLTMSLSACTTWDSYTDYAVQGNVGREANLAAAYKQLGFSNAVYFHYDKSRNDPSDSAAYSFAQKHGRKTARPKPSLRFSCGVPVTVQSGQAICIWVMVLCTKAFRARQQKHTRHSCNILHRHGRPAHWAMFRFG